MRMKGPPTALKPPPPRLARLLGFAWWLMLALAVVGQVGGMWAAHEEAMRIEPAFASAGLHAELDEEGRGFTVAPAAEGVAVAPGSRIAAVDGAPVARDALPFEVAPRLAGPDGTPVRLRLEAPDGGRSEVALVRSAQNREASGLSAAQSYTIGLFAAFALLALPYLAAAWLLRRRAFDNPVSVLLSFAFLGIAASVMGPQTFWERIGADVLNDLLFALWAALLVIALPAFPDGRFEPRWSRWLLVLAPAAAAVAGAGLASDTLHDLLFALLLGAALTALALRYRRTPRGPERQQMKWAAGGLFAGLAMMVAAVPLYLGATLLDVGGAVELVLFLITLLLVYVGLLFVPLGLLLSLARYRLNDADAVIGRSAGYAAVTMIIGVVWAVSMSWANRLIGETLGGGPALTTAASTLVAGLVFLPAKDRVLGWTERRFQPALVRLRGLPAKLAQWQHGDDPGELGRAALAAIVEGVGASGGALVGTESGSPSIHALYGGGAGAAPDAAFPIRIPLSDGAREVGALLLGPRSDGASYSADEKAALDMVAEPLAHALRDTARRARTALALAASLGALEERIARLEEMRGTSG
jgi:hypothetical protein